MDERVTFFETKSVFEENWAEKTTSGALRSQATNGSGGGIVCKANDRHAVCYGIDQQGGKSNCGCAENVMPTLCSDSHGTPHAVCYVVDCRNGALDEEKTHTIQAKPQGGFSLNCTPSVCYSIEGHIVDRETAQNGKGYAEGYAHTLNATDRHAVCYAYDGSSVTSKLHKEIEREGLCHTLNTDSRNYVVIVLNDQGGGVMSVDDKPATLLAQMKHHEPIVCFQNTGQGWWKESQTGETLRCHPGSWFENVVVDKK